MNNFDGTTLKCVECGADNVIKMATDYDKKTDRVSSTEKFKLKYLKYPCLKRFGETIHGRRASIFGYRFQTMGKWFMK